MTAPPLALLLAGALVVLFWFQTRLPDGGLSMALRPADLAEGVWTGLFTSMLVHGGWSHVVMNAVGTLAFGAPLARALARGGGPTAFVALYVACGLAGGLGYAAVHWGDATPVVGASGGVFGLIGASTRLMYEPGRVSRLLNPAVLRAAAAWLGVNLIVGLVGYAPGMEGARVAWEAHLFGFLAGILLIGPLHRLFGVSQTADRGR